MFSVFPTEPAHLRSGRAGRGCFENSSSARSTGKCSRRDGIWGIGVRWGKEESKESLPQSLHFKTGHGMLLLLNCFVCLEKVDKPLPQMFGLLFILF